MTILFCLIVALFQMFIVGLLLFSILTTPVGTLTSTFWISDNQFADDTWLYTAIKSKTNKNLVVLSSCADAVTGWAVENDLLLNAATAEAPAVGIRQRVA